MPRVRAAAVVLIATAAALVGLSGCLATTDDPANWREEARVAAGTGYSQLLTVRLAIVQRDRLVGQYVVTVVADAEKALGSASRHVSGTQPPPSLRPAYDRLTRLLDRAGSLVAEARMAVGEDRTGRYDALVRRIDDLAPRLERMEKELGG